MGFGRRFIDVEPAALTAEVLYQLGALDACARAAGLPVRFEAYADRAYQPTGALVDRRGPGAVLHDPGEIASRCVELATEGHVRAVDGRVLRLRVDSICVRGDTPGAVGIARAVRRALTGAGVELRPFTAERHKPSA